MRNCKNFGVLSGVILFSGTIMLARQLQVSVGEPPSPSFSAQRSSEISGLRLVKFGGVLKGPLRQPLTGLAGITFAIYKDQEGGAPLWLETQNVQLNQGNYSVLLGSTTGEGIPLDIFSSYEPRWLGVRAQIPDSEEQPRLLLVGVPYALKAADADTLGGKPISAFVLADSGKGDSSGSNSDKASLSKTASANTDALNVVSGTAGYIARFLNSTDLGDSSIFESGGNVGVGTTTPFYPLNVAKSTYTSTTPGSNILLRLQSNASGADSNIQFSDGVANSAQFGMQNGAFYITSNGAEFFRISPNGNTGIGTTTPFYPLNVARSTYTSTTPGSNILLRLQSNGNGADANIQFSDGVANSAQFGMQNGAYYITSNGQEFFRISNSGNVGIGTTTPTQKLDVAGAAKVTSSGGASVDVRLPPAAFASQYTGTSGVGVVGYGNDPVNTNAGVLGASNSSAGWGGFFLNFNSTGRSLSAFDSALNETFIVGANGRVMIGGNGIPGPTNLAKLTVKASGTAGVVNGTGTVSVTTGSNTLTGSGTAFLSELGVGDRIIVTSTNQALIITAIASDTSATISFTTPLTAAGSPYTIQQAHFRLDDSGGTARMVIQNQGNATPRIGVGTVVPGDTLDVRGTVLTTSKVTIGPNNNRRSLFTVKGVSFAQNAGTVSVSNSSTTVSGTNTAFLTQVGLGDRLAIGAPVNETRTVVAITDNLTLTVDSPFGSASSGVTTTTIPALIRADDVSGNSKFLVNDTGKVGIGTLMPDRELEVNGGIRLNTVAAKPACDASLRGTFWVTQGGPGVADTVEACTKDASDAYAWRPLL